MINDETGELIPKMDELVKSITGVEIFDKQKNTFKSTYDILLEISKVWDSISDPQRAMLLEKIAGKNRANVISAILSNGKDLEKGLSQALGAAGSSSKELDKYLGSVDAKINQLKNNMVTMATNTLDSGFIKIILDTTNGVISLVNELELIPALLISVGLALSGLGLQSLIGILPKIVMGFNSLGFAMKMVAVGTWSLNDALLLLNVNPVVASITALTIALVAIPKLIDTFTVSIEEQSEKVNKLKDGYDGLKSEIDSLSAISNPTDAQKERIGLLQQELDIQKKLLEIEQRKLDNKTFKEAMKESKLALDSITGLITLYNEEVNKLSNPSISGDEKNRRDNQINEYKEVLAERYQEILQEKKNIQDSIKSLPQEDTKAATERLKLLDVTLDQIGAIINLNDVTEEQEKLLEDSIVSATTFKDVYSEISKATKETIDGTKELNQAINSLNEGQTLTSDTIISLLDKYPQLRNQITETNGVYSLSVGALEDVRDMSISEQKSCIEGQINKTKTVIKETLNRIASYRSELSAIKTLGEAQSTLAAMSKEKVVSNSDGMMTLSQDGAIMSKERKKALAELADVVSKYEEIGKLETELLKLDIGSSVSNTKAGSGIKDKASGKSKEITNQLDSIIETIQSKRNKIDNEIALLSEQLKLKELAGDIDSVNKINAELDKLYTKRADSTMEENKAYEVLKKKYRATEDLAKLESLISDNNKSYQTDKINDLEHEISLIQRKYDIERQTMDEKLQQIELEQALMNDDSDNYANKETEKYNIMLARQKSYMAQVSDLKAKGFTKESEEIKTLLNEYYNLEMSKFNMVKWFADKAKKADLDRVTTQKKAIDDLTQYTIDMLKQEEQAKANSLKKELSDYEKIINARKKALQDQAKEEDYQGELSKKQKELSDIQQKIKAGMLDDSDAGSAKIVALKEQEAKLIEEINKTQRDKGLELEQSALDDELDRFKEQQEEKIASIESEINNEVKLRERAIKLIESRNKSLYQNLLKWSSEYGKVSSDDITNAWDTAGGALDQYSEKTKKLIELQKLLAKEVENINNPNNDSYVNDSQTNLNKPTNNGSNGLSEKGKQQANQKIYLDNLYAKALKEKNEGLKRWIEEERKRWSLDPKTGKILKQYHNGIENGLIGNYSLKGFEEIVKVAKGEGIFTVPQMKNINNELKSKSGNTMQIENLVTLNVEGNLDNSVLPSLQQTIKVAIDNAMDKLNNNRFGVAYR